MHASRAWMAILMVVAAASVAAAENADCNDNGTRDDVEIAEGSALDCDGNGVPDECDTAVTFATHTITSSADGADSISTADVDGDGDVDVLLSALNDGKATWYPNTDGAGSFGPPRPIATVTTARSIVAADIDGDLDNDAVLAAATQDQVVWYENLTGIGQFGPGQTITGALDAPWTIDVADLDDDGDLDVVAVSINNVVAWSENLDGAGTFGPATVISTSALFPISVAATDLDGDGDLDVLVASITDSSVVWHENVDGQANFGPEQTISTSTGGASVAVGGDLDGDGDTDVLTAGSADDTLAWHDKLDGLKQFGARQSIAIGPNQPLSVVAADLDGDSDLDVVSASQSDDTIRWFENLDGVGTFGEERTISTMVHSARAVHVADLDADGDLDVLATSLADDALFWFENLADDCDGNGTPDSCQPDCNANGRADVCDLTAAADVDCNGNQVPDACDIAGPESDDCTGNGIPDECEPDCNGNQSADSCDIAGEASDDCTGNGIPDECEPDCDGSRSADSCDIAGGADDCDVDGQLDSCQISGGSPDCDGNGVLDTCQTSLVFTPSIVTTVADFPLSVFLADVDGDEDLDVLSASSVDNTIAWYENVDGDGTFGPRIVISTATLGAFTVFAADVDGDRDIDVLSASQFDDKLAWYENLDGQGSFGPQRVISVSGDGVRSVFAADLDGDGDADVLAAASFDREVSWYENLDGQGSFGWPQVLSFDEVPAVALAADLDADGDADVVSAFEVADRVRWQRNRDFGFSSGKLITDSRDGPRALFAADIDGDGDADVLLGSQDDDTVVWFENTNGNGAFGPSRLITPTANGATAVFAVDVDGDADLDVASVSFFDGRVAWYENLDGLGNFGSPRDLFVTAEGPRSIFAGDLDGDRDADLVFSTLNDDSITWLRNESDDCNGNLVPDVCDVDCDGNGIPDDCEPDCNGNLIADVCEVLAGATDCDGDLVPDECQPDCNGNLVADSCDIAGETSDDCDANLEPDECQPDCSGDGVPDSCEPDCDGNGIADPCDPDCNGNDVADACDVASGTSLDCNGNGVPDGCESQCGCDVDQDLCLDDLETDPADNEVCGDTDADGCDDCSRGFFDLAGDGLDDDDDGVCVVADCDDDNSTVWLESGPVSGLVLFKEGFATTLVWQKPQDAGAVLVRYDTLRSFVASDFLDATTSCLGFDSLQPTVQDGNDPQESQVFYYLIRAENACPGAVGNLGADSSGAPRSGIACP